MAYWSPRRWDDFKAMFPNQTRSPAAIAVWSILIILDLVLGGWVAMRLGIDIFTKAGGYLFTAAVLGVAGGAFFLENLLYSTFRRLFH